MITLITNPEQERFEAASQEAAYHLLCCRQILKWMSWALGELP